MDYHATFRDLLDARAKNNWGRADVLRAALEADLNAKLSYHKNGRITFIRDGHIPVGYFDGATGELLYRA